MIKNLWTFVGLEDARLVKWDDKYFLCGASEEIQPQTAKEGQNFEEIIITKGNVVEINRSRIGILIKNSQL